MAKLEEVLPALREGKKIRKDKCIVYLDGGELFCEEGGHKEPYFLDSDHIFFQDWEIVPEPVKVADYLVPASSDWVEVSRKEVLSVNGLIYQRDIVYIKQTHTIGQQPWGSVLIPGSKREVGE